MWKPLSRRPPLWPVSLITFFGKLLIEITLDKWAVVIINGQVVK